MTALANVAKHYLTPSPTTVSVEKLFSMAGDISTNDRNREKSTKNSVP